MLSQLGQYSSDRWSDSAYVYVSRYNSGIPISIKENYFNISEVKFYPNPFKGYATIEFNLQTDITVDIWLLDFSGRLIKVLKHNYELKKGQSKFEVDNFQNLSEGNYLITISNSNGQVSIPIVKKN